ncbi:hypothetical protein [Aeoliella mucimassa]|uniref:Uncharacterized protein n=1 Tax=Aeoliella mucimassa TaxID=2527972 RepID=A0A518AHA0_9BACT|nr:hypothetical protein [Aeoliella mucimassa]QDU54098.1 hypothetical protein Pan181_02780 [Aeoliella mucimassa]
MRWCIVLHLVFVVVVATTGCHGSRWAKRDADYRQKYPEHSDDTLQTIKQAVDARHVKHKGGKYVALAGRDDPFAGGIDVGGFVYPEPWLELRGGLSGLVHESGKRPYSAGLLTSARVQPPSRFAPFAGVGGYLGWAGCDFRDIGDHTYFPEEETYFPEVEEEETSLGGELIGAAIVGTATAKHEFVVAAFPEVGAHFWIDHRRRVTVSASYWFSNQDYNEDFLFFTIGFSWFGDEYQDFEMTTSKPFHPGELPDLPMPPPQAEPAPGSPYASLEFDNAPATSPYDSAVAPVEPVTTEVLPPYPVARILPEGPEFPVESSPSQEPTLPKE